MHVCIQDFGERKHERSSLISSRMSLIQNAAAGRADGAQASCARTGKYILQYADETGDKIY